MLVVIIKNLMPDFKLINKIEFYTAGIILAKEYFSIFIIKGIILYFKPLAVILF